MTTVPAEPSFLVERRAAAASEAAGLELPQYKGAAGWEFTPIAKLDLAAFPVAPGGAEDAAEHLLDLDLEAAVRPSADDATSEGPVVLPLAVAAERHPDIVERHLGAVVTARTRFTAENDARWTDGAFVYVPRGVHVEAPIVLTTVHEQAGTALHQRVLVVLEEDAQAEVWHQTLSADREAEGLVNGVVELVVGQNAHLRFVDAQDLSEKAWNFGAQRAVVERDGSLDWITLGFGSRDGKVFLETKLAGPGASANVTGAYATRGRQHLDFDTLQEHAAPDTTSDLAFRGILNGRSSSVWRGMIQVDEGAQRTDAFQESRNLLLTKQAHADAIPGLEILANDVRCTHAAAIAQIDKEQLFYLRSHGLPEPAAHRLVVEGFLQALVERFEEGPVREAVAGALERRLALALGA
ncbi:MAG: Fe-S cluster assembly protein SufD [Solirubrobacteraceae bacterium]|jgi:Fe-S cluster assembly protein SufD|nr:Fe-S cluster assembly protein SufD [Solirubrobacteraceae bacterium]